MQKQGKQRRICKGQLKPVLCMRRKFKHLKNNHFMKLILFSALLFLFQPLFNPIKRKP